jgi:TRAP-type uncharacterized transport system substrate-binding protein
VAAAIAFAAPASAQMYGFGTGKQESLTYSAEAAIAKIASDNGMNLRLQPFGGQSAFVPGINAGEIQFGIANELETHSAVTGEAIYKGKPQKDLRVLAILTPPSPEAMARMRKFIPVAYPSKLDPGKGRLGIIAPTGVYVIDFLVLVNKNVPDAQVYKLAKIMHDHKSGLAASFGAHGFNPDRMSKEMTQVQFHPGALKYYREIGAWPPRSGG